MPNHLKALPAVLFTCALGVMALAAAFGDDAAQATPTTHPATTPSADQVMTDLGSKIERNPAIEPGIRPGGEKTHAPRNSKIVVDPAIAGTSPVNAGVKTELRREGVFILNRVGRLDHDSKGRPMLVFDADSQLGYDPKTHVADEPPILLSPNQVLESMENQAGDLGDRMEFVVAGQVSTYRGANYLSLTSAKVVVDKGNFVK